MRLLIKQPKPHSLACRGRWAVVIHVQLQLAPQRPSHVACLSAGDSNLQKANDRSPASSEPCRMVKCGRFKIAEGERPLSSLIRVMSRA